VEVRIGDEALVEGLPRDGAVDFELGVVVFRGGLNLELLVKRFQLGSVNCRLGSDRVCRVDSRSVTTGTYT